MGLKRATQAYSLFLDGEAFVVTPGMILDEADDRYREEAGKFEDVEAYAKRIAKTETATAAPDEKRTRTTAKKASTAKDK